MSLLNPVLKIQNRLIQKFGWTNYWIFYFSIFFTLLMIVFTAIIFRINPRFAPWFLLFTTIFFIIFEISIYIKGLKKDDFEITDISPILFIFSILVYFLYLPMISSFIFFSFQTPYSYFEYGSNSTITTIDLKNAAVYGFGSFVGANFNNLIPNGDFALFSIIEAYFGFFIFAAVITYFLTLIHQKQLEKQWKPIKKLTYQQIKESIESLDYDLLKLYEGFGQVYHENYQKEKINLWNKFIKTQENLLMNQLKERFKEAKEKYPSLYEIYKKDFSDIEIKYGQYISSKERIILMKIQRELNQLHFSLFIDRPEEFIEPSKKIFKLFKEIEEEKLFHAD